MKNNSNDSFSPIIITPEFVTDLQSVLFNNDSCQAGGMEIAPGSPSVEGKSRVKSIPAFSLNNGTRDAFTRVPFLENAAHDEGVVLFRDRDGHDCQSELSSGERVLLEMEPEGSGWSPAQRRDILEAALRISTTVTWSGSPWSLIDAWKREVITSERIPAEKGLRLSRYWDCYRPHMIGSVGVDEVGGLHGQLYGCGDSHCLLCQTRHRRRLASEHVDRMRKIIESQEEGFEGVYSFVFTLPAGIEGSVAKNAGVAREISNGVQGILREIFGVGYRSNLYMILAAHPVGDNDLFRNRWHLHVTVLPCEVAGGKFHWVQPVKNSRGMLDVSKLGDLWNRLLGDVFGDVFGRAINPQVRFIRAGREETGAIQGRFWAWLHHRVRYDLRSFAADVERAVLRVHRGADVCGFSVAVVKSQRGSDLYWHMVSLGALIDRFLMLKSINVVRCRGLAQCMNRYAELIGIRMDEGDEMKIVNNIPAVVEIVRKREWDPVAKRVVVRRAEIYHFTRPDTGERVSVDSRKLCEMRIRI